MRCWSYIRTHCCLKTNSKCSWDFLQLGAAQQAHVPGSSVNKVTLQGQGHNVTSCSKVNNSEKISSRKPQNQVSFLQ